MDEGALEALIERAEEQGRLYAKIYKAARYEIVKDTKEYRSNVEITRAAHAIALKLLHK